MTPAIKILEAAGYRFTLHLYSSESGRGYGARAAQMLAKDPEQVYKTLVVDLEDQQPIIALIPVSKELSMKRLAKCAGSRNAKILDADKAEDITGYLIGGICPFGMKNNLRVYAHTSLPGFIKVFINGGKRGIELELKSRDLTTITQATIGDIAD